MQASNRIKNYIKSKETLQLHAYNDGEGNLTIGWGHELISSSATSSAKTITEAEAEQFFDNDILLAERAVNKYLKVALSQQEFDACVSFTFNDGIGGFIGSYVLRQLNAGQKIDAFSYLARYCHSGNTALEGLLIRRAEEILIACGKPVGNY